VALMILSWKNTVNWSLYLQLNVGGNQNKRLKVVRVEVEVERVFSCLPQKISGNWAKLGAVRSTLGQHLVKTWLRCGLVHEYARE
jgi:hypothetical protein